MCARLNLFLLSLSLPVYIEGQWCERRRPHSPQHLVFRSVCAHMDPLVPLLAGPKPNPVSLAPSLRNLQGPEGATQETHNHSSTRTKIPQSLRTTSQLQVILSLEHHFKALRVTLYIIALPSRLTLRGAGEIVRREKKRNEK